MWTKVVLLRSHHSKNPITRGIVARASQAFRYSQYAAQHVWWHDCFIPSNMLCSILARMDSLTCSSFPFSSSLSLHLSSLCCLPSIQPQRFCMGDKPDVLAGHAKKGPPGTLSAMYAMLAADLCRPALSCCICHLSAQWPACWSNLLPSGTKWL